MRGFVALAALSLPVLGAAQSGTSKTVWVRKQMTPEAFALRTDSSMQKLSGVSADTLGRIDFYDLKKERNTGKHEGKLYIYLPKVFRMEYPFASDAKGHTDLITFKDVADGKQFMRRRYGGWKDRGPISTRPLLPGGVLSTWVAVGAGRILSSIGTSQKPLTQLVKELRAAGATMTVEMSSGSAMMRERLHAVRKGKGKIKPLDIEIVVESGRGLPLMLFTDTQDGRGKRIMSRWAAKWNLSPGQDFKPELFQFK